MSIPAIYRGLTTPVPNEGQPSPKATDLKKVEQNEFKKALETQLTLSGHAKSRIQSRELSWGPEVQKRVENAIELAQSKGSREALILADDIALIANVESKTVVTAMDRNHLSKGKIFTNIDSAVLA